LHYTARCFRLKYSLNSLCNSTDDVFVQLNTSLLTETNRKWSRAQLEVAWVGLSTSTYSSLSADDVIDITSFPVLPSRSRFSLVRRFWNQTFTCQ